MFDLLILTIVIVGAFFIWRWLKSDHNKICAWCGIKGIKFSSGEAGTWEWKFSNKDGSRDKRRKNNFEIAQYHSVYNCPECSGITEFRHVVDQNPSEKVKVWKRELKTNGDGERKESDWEDRTTSG